MNLKFRSLIIARDISQSCSTKVLMMTSAHLIAFYIFLSDINNMRLMNLQMIVSSMLYFFLIFDKTIIKFIVMI